MHDLKFTLVTSFKGSLVAVKTAIAIMYLQNSFILHKSVSTRIMDVWLGMLTQACWRFWRVNYEFKGSLVYIVISRAAPVT